MRPICCHDIDVFGFDMKGQVRRLVSSVKWALGLTTVWRDTVSKLREKRVPLKMVRFNSLTVTEKCVKRGWSQTP